MKTSGQIRLRLPPKPLLSLGRIRKVSHHIALPFLTVNVGARHVNVGARHELLSVPGMSY